MNAATLGALLRGDLANAAIASTPGGIEAQEAAGQGELVEKSMLPKGISGATREQLTALGFKFGADVDDLFVACELPPGWTKRATEHSMHSDLLDELGRKRANIFYKAAFYDRRAHMRMQRRFHVDPYRRGSQDGIPRCVVMDGDAVALDAGGWKYGNYTHLDALVAECESWLLSNYPEWRDPLAYW